MSDETEWVLVPREPTPEMLSAAGRLQACECGFVGDMSPMDGEEYAAMLAAAPQPPAEAQPVACAEDLFEQFLQHAIARSPEPLRELGEYLAGVLDDDQWPAADRLLLQLATATPSAPVGVEGWRVEPVEDDPDMLAVETPDGRTWFAKRGDRVFELAEALALAQQPAAPSGETGGDWVTVPRVPTDAMLDAMHGRIQILCDPAERTADIQNDAEVWGAMLTAAPQQPAADSPSFTAGDMTDAAAQGFRDGVASVGTAAAKDAEIERLRAEVATWEGLHASEVQVRQRWQARAERLAEALRDIESRPWNGVRPIQIASRAALRDHDQEVG